MFGMRRRRFLVGLVVVTFMYWITRTDDDVSSSGVASTKRANATFMMLTRNNELAGAIESIKDLERQFNARYHYPYVFLNDVEFTEEFKQGILEHTNSTVEFGLVPPEFWRQPDWIDERKAAETRERMEKDNIKYGGSQSYRNMCRFNSGFFYRHELMKKYRWYWRVEPEVRYHCIIHEDPFMYLEQNNKVYGWVMTPTDIEATIHTLWDHVKDFVKLHPEHLASNNALEFLSKDGGKTYNTCHFWSNFEIADMEFYRGKAYSEYFEYLDSKGGFYYERWGDAPVHSIAMALFAQPSQLHFFHDIGYYHGGWTHCPLDKKAYEKGECTCDQGKSFDNDYWSCKSDWDKFIKENTRLWGLLRIWRGKKMERQTFGLD